MDSVETVVETINTLPPKVENTIKLALDCHFPKIKELLPEKYEIVHNAPPGELDALWIGDAKQKGAQFVVSRDYDIEFWCDRNGMESIWVPEYQSRTSEKFVKYLLKEIERYEKE